MHVEHLPLDNHHPEALGNTEEGGKFGIDSSFRRVAKEEAPVEGRTILTKRPGN